MNSSPSPYGPMTPLQNLWYNSLCSELGLNRQAFQIIQPSLFVKNDSDLWAIQNQIPPFALTWNQWVYSSSLFFTEYAAVVEQMQFPESTFESDIGTSNYQAWEKYLKTLSPPPLSNKLPTVFRNWAIRNAPDVANKGASDLARIVLIDSAKNAIAPYQGSNAKPIDFADTFSQLSSLLSQSQSASFTLDYSTTSADVGDTWTQGIDSCFFGLWTGSWCSKSLSKKFAAIKVQVSVQFEHWTLLTSTPGAWYNSSLLNSAYSSKATPPWPDSPNLTWDDIFGSQGSMQRLIASLLVVDGMTVTVTSDATFNATEQMSIKQYCQHGFWPFYCQSAPSSGAITNTVTFPNNTLKLQGVATTGNPIVIGNNVLGIAQYLGRAAL